MDLDRNSKGRVLLSDFYRATLDGVVPNPFEFDESIEFLRQLGAVDESNPAQPSVLIPNYVNARTNCLTTTSFYSVCCIDECERLLARLESVIGAPAATPTVIYELVENLPSDTVEAPRNLSDTLVRRLQEVADRHDGKVPLHSRLFAQWMHHAYPSECIFPHVHGVSSVVSSDEWLAEGDRHVSEEVMRQFVGEEAESDPNGHTETIHNMNREVEIMWTEEEELFAVSPNSLAAVGIFRQFCRCAALAVVLGAVAFNLVKVWTDSRSSLLPEKDFSKCV